MTNGDSVLNRSEQNSLVREGPGPVWPATDALCTGGCAAGGTQGVGRWWIDSGVLGNPLPGGRGSLSWGVPTAA